MARLVNTVAGPVSTDALGLTLMHEHVKVSMLGSELDPTVDRDTGRVLEEAVGALQDLPGLGVKTILDPLPIDLGRDVEIMREVSRRTGLHIIAATGFYHHESGIPTHFRRRTADQMAEVMVHELTRGVGNTEIRPAVIKCATWSGAITEHEEKAVRAAGRAHRATGAPITTHTTGGALGPEQLDLLRQEGVDPERVIIGHCDANTDLRYFKAILDRGAWVSIDQIGSTHVNTDDVRAGLVSAIVAMGYGHKLVLSQDRVACFAYGYTLPSHLPISQYPRGFTGIVTSFLPVLKSQGVTEQMLHRILVENPRRYFEG